MLKKLKDLLFGLPPIEKNHNFFGKILYMDGKNPEQNDYWENEQVVDGVKDPVSVFITAGIEGPTTEQVTFYKECINDLDKLFDKCWPIFEPDFEQLTHAKFTGYWKDSFELMSIEIPKNANSNNNWSVGYYVDKAHHYFTAQFVNGVPKHNEIDG